MRQLFIGVVMAAWFAVNPFLVNAQVSVITQGVSIDSLFAQTETAIEQSRLKNADLLAPQQFQRAKDALAEAKSLHDRKRDSELIRIKLNVALDEVQRANRTAENARGRMADLLAQRSSAIEAGADSLSGSWPKAESQLRVLAREFERSPSDVRDSEMNELSGVYRAARREALRAALLSEARDLINQVEKKDGARIVPVLLLRAHQALSRAEAALAQEKLDSARVDAEAAVFSARHALGFMSVIESAQKEKTPWQSALLPYDDLMLSIGERLNVELDMSKGGAEGGKQLPMRIDERQDSLLELSRAQDQTIRSLEASLAEAQTSLANAQSRIAELENRLKSSEGARSTAAEQLQKGAEFTDRIARAQGLFKANEATVLQDRNGAVIIRLWSLRFAPGATKLDKTHSRLLDKVVEAINLFPGASARVDGHTDSEGSEDLNLKLSESRAKTVAAYLVKKLSWPLEKLPAYGLGESQPIADNDTAEGRLRNRRVDVVLTISN